MSSAYQATLDYLYTFANFEHRRLDQYTADNVDPARPARLLEHLGGPHLAFPSIHIAGTKGKGSVAAFCASALRAAGLRVGLYTSPHLQEFRERFRVLTTEDADGHITEDAFVALVEEIKQVVPQVPGLTWFELVTAIAFLHFAQQKIDVGVIEVGLGGRLDATNVIAPLVSVITSISYDHTYLLGNTLAEIAGEKAGIIKPGVPVVTAPQTAEALARIAAIATERNAPLTVVGQEWTWQALETRPEGQTIRIIQPQTSDVLKISDVFVPLAGAHQQENAVTAIAALNVVRPHFPALTDQAIVTGIAQAQWPGRLQTVHRKNGDPTLLVDAAHNVDSAMKIAETLRQDFKYHKLWLVFGATADKDIAGMMQILLPLAAGTIVTAAPHPRAATPPELQQIAESLGHEVATSPNVESAVATAWKAAGPDDLILVTGSIFIAGDLLNRWEGLQSQLDLESKNVIRET